jgi:hypothetical protein
MLYILIILQHHQLHATKFTTYIKNNRHQNIDTINKLNIINFRNCIFLYNYYGFSLHLPGNRRDFTVLGNYFEAHLLMIDSRIIKFLNYW